MEFLGVGPLEFFFILILALIILGPNDMIKTGRQLGSFLRKLVKTETWQAIQQTSHDIRYLPNKLMRESGLDEEVNEIGKIGKDLEASANEVQTSIKGMQSSVINEVDNAVKDMKVTVPVDDLKKTAEDINRDFTDLSSQAKRSDTSAAAPQPSVLDKTDQQSIEEEKILSSSNADCEADAEAITDAAAELETPCAAVSAVKIEADDIPESPQEDNSSVGNQSLSEPDIENP